MAQMVKNLPAMQETRVRSLEKEMATHSSILAWEIPWMEEPGRLQSMGSQKVGQTISSGGRVAGWELSILSADLFLILNLFF